MSWELGVAVAAVIVFFGLRFTARGWIIDGGVIGGLLDYATVSGVKVQLERNCEADQPS